MNHIGNLQKHSNPAPQIAVSLQLFFGFRVRELQCIGKAGVTRVFFAKKSNQERLVIEKQCMALSEKKNIQRGTVPISVFDFISNTDKKAQIRHNGVGKIGICFIHLLIFLDAFSKLPGLLFPVHFLWFYNKCWGQVMSLTPSLDNVQ